MPRCDIPKDAEGSENVLRTILRFINKCKVLLSLCGGFSSCFSFDIFFLLLFDPFFLRCDFWSIIMEYITMGDLCASTGKYEIESRGVGMEDGHGDIRVDAAGSLFGTLR